MTWNGEERRAFITDHDVLIRIETKMDRALADISSIDTRVAILEQGYWKVVGCVTVFVVVGDALLKWYFK